MSKCFSTRRASGDRNTGNEACHKRGQTPHQSLLLDQSPSKYFCSSSMCQVHRQKWGLYQIQCLHNRRDKSFETLGGCVKSEMQEEPYRRGQDVTIGHTTRTFRFQGYRGNFVVLLKQGSLTCQGDGHELHRRVRVNGRTDKASWISEREHSLLQIPLLCILSKGTKGVWSVVVVKLGDDMGFPSVCFTG